MKVTEIITGKFIQAIEEGKNPFYIKPWIVDGLSIEPKNFLSGTIYRGLNKILLSLIPYEIPLYCTFKQAKKEGLEAKGSLKGKGISVVYWVWTYLDDNGNKITEQQYKLLPKDKRDKRGSARYYTVFNISHFDIDTSQYIDKDQDNVNEIQTIQDAQNLFESTGAKLRIEGARAFYRPSIDRITMPRIEAFKSSEFYYSVLFHELGHWTGHKSRLNRLEPAKFGTEKYAKEELVAELTSSFIMASLGIDSESTFDNSIAYLKGWLKPLKDDSNFIISAASKANKAFKLITEGNTVPV